VQKAVPEIEIESCDPRGADAQDCLRQYFQLLLDRIDALSPHDLPAPGDDAAAYGGPTGIFLIARCKGRPVGCVALKTLAPGVGEVKRLWVAPEARGQGLARRLMREIETSARHMGQSRLWLDTNGALTEAVALYSADGWVTIPAYTGWPATHWFGKEL
jgi:GNAT superfamily N-acetyltransferase